MGLEILLGMGGWIMWLLICLHYRIAYSIMYPHLPPQTMVNTQQTSTTVATASVGMVLYEHVEDGQELFL